MPRQIMWFQRENDYLVSLHPDGEGFQFSVPLGWGAWLRDRSDNKPGLGVPHRSKWREGKIQQRFGIELLVRAIRERLVALTPADLGAPSVDDLVALQITARGFGSGADGVLTVEGETWEEGLHD